MISPLLLCLLGGFITSIIIAVYSIAVWVAKNEKEMEDHNRELTIDDFIN